MTRLPRTARMTGASAGARATGATAKAATRPYRRIRSSEVQMVSTVTRSDGPVSGEAAMPNSTAAIAQQVPHDRATVRAKRAARGARHAPDRHDRQRHPDREPGEVARQPHAQLRRVARVEEEDREPEGRRGVHGDAGQQATGAPVGVGEAPLAEPGVPVQEDGGDRQHGVPGDLDGEAPDLPEARRPEHAAPPRMRLVRVGERQQFQPGPGVAEVGGQDDDHDVRDDEPVRGEDAHRAPPEVGPDAHPAAVGVEQVRHPRPVEQEARQREEDRHRDRAAGEQPRRSVLLQRAAGVGGHVEHQNPEGRDRAYAVERVVVLLRPGPGGPRGAIVAGGEGVVTGNLRSGTESLRAGNMIATKITPSVHKCRIRL